MIPFYFNPQVHILLINQTNDRVQMRYDNNPFTWSMPLIGPRPPYYTNPRYVFNYPVI